MPLDAVIKELKILTYDEMQTLALGIRRAVVMPEKGASFCAEDLARGVNSWIKSGAK